MVCVCVVWCGCGLGGVWFWVCVIWRCEVWGVVLAPSGSAAWPPPPFGGAAFLPLSCWMVLICHLFPPGVFFFDKGTGLPCVWFPWAVSHGDLRIQHGCQWPSLWGKLSVCTREVLGDCGVAVLVRV